MLVGFMAALGAGVVRAAARSANARFAADAGVAWSTFFNFAIGLAVSAGALMLAGDGGLLRELDNVHLPPWAYLGGLAGVLFVVCSNIATPRMSAFSMTVLILLGQIAAGIALDAVLRGSLAPQQILGSALLFSGLYWDTSASRGACDRTNERRGRTVVGL